MSDDEEDLEGVEIPAEKLSPDALLGVIDEFVTREGTEYGPDDVPLETKRAAVKVQLAKGEVVILFDPKAGTVNLVHRRELGR